MRKPYYNNVMYPYTESCHTENLLISKDTFDRQYCEQEQEQEWMDDFSFSLYFTLVTGN